MMQTNFKTRNYASTARRKEFNAGRVKPDPQTLWKPEPSKLTRDEFRKIVMDILG